MSQIPPSSPPPKPTTQSYSQPASVPPASPSTGFTPGGPAVNPRRFDKLPPRPTLHPRRVVGGIRMTSRPPAAIVGDVVEVTPEAAAATASGWTWVSARWMRPAEEHAPGDQYSEGLDYARGGQTRALEFKPGLISARVQGRMPQAYKCAVRLPTFTPEQWEKVTHLMASQAKYAAALLAGELPTNIEDMFAPVGLHLFPTDASDLSVSCDCDIFTGRVRDYATLQTGAPVLPTKPAKAGPGVPWCKHVCCTMFLIADMLGRQPLAIFSVRGLAESDLVERLRQARALQGMQRAGAVAAPVYTPHIPGLATENTPLEDTLHHFWTAAEPDALDGLDMPIAPPEVSHPLLRRVGPSPFTGAKFPITGLLATCYDVISEAMIKEGDEPRRD